MSSTAWISDDAYAAYVKWMDGVLKDPSLNEDTTRMRLIDAILFDILKWDRNFVETEPYVKKEGFADYIFTTRGGRALVLEAKRAGATFVLPDQEPYQDRAVSFKYISDKCPAAHEAMQQGVTYANAVGVRYTVISNGRQWLLMMTSVEGSLLEERNVIVFESLEAIKTRFSTFWNCLSPLMIQVNKPFSLLIDVRRQPAPAKLSATIAQYPVRREEANIRNHHATSIQYIWDEINNNEGTKTFFEECYVPPVGHEKNSGLATQLLSDRATEDTKNFERLQASQMPDLLGNPTRPERPVILLGRIGRGKTTFLKYLKTMAAPETLKKYLQIDINFLDLPRTKEEVASYVYGAIRQQLSDGYSIDVEADNIVRSSLRGLLNKFKKTSRAKYYLDKGDENGFKEAELTYIEEKTKESHFYLSLVTHHHLHGSLGKSIVIFFDNLDKRAELQEEAFLIASAIARDWAAVVFICLRPGTFQRSRDLGVLDSVAPRIMHVSAPPIPVFLKRRFKYGAAIALGEKPPPRANDALSKSIAQDGADVAALFSSFSESFRRDKSLDALFDAVSNGNLRDILVRIGATITSWHLNTIEMLEAIQKTGDYYVSYHQALRALLLGASHYFDEKRSPIVNLLDIQHADPIEHFLRPICLFHLTDLARETTNQGFTAYEELAARVGNYTYTPDAIDAALRLLFAKRLIEDDNFSEEWPGTSSAYRLTALGRYHISSLMGEFTYLDAVVYDTPILDTDIAREIKNVEPIAERMRRGRAFLRYLNNCAESVVHTPFYSHWDRVHSSVAEELTMIERKMRLLGV